jgi:hypothetical protein
LKEIAGTRLQDLVGILLTSPRENEAFKRSDRLKTYISLPRFLAEGLEFEQGKRQDVVNSEAHMHRQINQSSRTRTLATSKINVGGEVVEYAE